MHDPKIVTIVSASDAMESARLDFGDALAADAWWKAVGAEYAIDTPSGHVRITGAALRSLVTQSQMEACITTSTTGHADAQPDGNTIYVLSGEDDERREPGRRRIASS